MRPFRGLTDNDVIVARAGRRGVRAGGEEEEEERSAGPPALAARGLGLRGGKKRKRGGACSQAPSQMGQGVVSRVVSITQVRRHFLIQGVASSPSRTGGGEGAGRGRGRGAAGEAKKRGWRKKGVPLLIPARFPLPLKDATTHRSGHFYYAHVHRQGLRGVLEKGWGRKKRECAFSLEKTKKRVLLLLLVCHRR